MKSRVYCLIGLCLGLVSLSSLGYEQGSYSRFSYSTLGQVPIWKIPRFTNAIEKDLVIELSSLHEFSNGMNEIFYDLLQPKGSFYESNFFRAEARQAFISLVKEFGCLEYRYRHSLPQTTHCGGMVKDHKVKEPFPFLSGYYYSRPLSVYYKGKLFGYELKLSRGDRFPKENAFYPVHQLGSFFSTSFDKKSIVLTISVNGDKLDPSGYPAERVFEGEPAVFLVLPPAFSIYKQKSGQQAGAFAADNAKILFIP